MKGNRKSVKERVDSHRVWLQWVGVLIVLLGLIGIIGLWAGMRQGRIWDSQRRLTIAVVETGQPNHLKLFSIQPGDNLVMVDLAGSVKMRMARGYGYYLVSSLYGLAKQEENLDLITETLTQELGVPVEGLIVAPESKCSQSVIREEQVACLRSTIKEWWWSRQIESTLSRGDRFAIWLVAREMGDDMFGFVDFSQGQWARETRDVDGFPLVEFDKNAIDAYVPSNLADTLISSENLKARVVNTVMVSGLANQVARIVNGMGVKVVEVRNTSGGLGQCVVQTRKELVESLTLKRLVDVFDCKLDERELEDTRADVEVRVGFEQARVWRGVSSDL